MPRLLGLAIFGLGLIGIAPLDGRSQDRSSGVKDRLDAARKNNRPPVAAGDAYTVPEDGILRVRHTAVRPASVVADVRKEDAARTIDGDAWTYWQAAGDNPAITFDLGKVRAVSGISESTGGFPGNPFTLSASTDNVAFKQILQGTLTESGIGEHVFSPLNARYLRLNIHSTGSGGFGELAEFKALVPDVVLANDTDPDGDALTAVLVRGPKHGKLEFKGDGSFIYKPNPNFNGTDRFTYKPDDGLVLGNTAVVTITVTSVNDPPSSVDDTATTDGTSPVNIRVLANDSDIDGDTLNVVDVTQGKDGAVVVNSDKTVTYTPGRQFQGSDSFTYTISDGQGGTATARVTIKSAPTRK